MTAKLARSGAAHDEGSTSAPGWTVRQSAWLLIARVLPQVYVLSVSILVARTLGADGMGRQGFIAFVSVSLVTAVTGGLPLAVMRFVSERAGASDFAAVRELVAWNGRVARWGAGLGAVALVIAAGFGALPRAAWLFAAIVVAATVLHTVPSALLNGLHRWKDATIAGVVTGGFTAATVAGVLVAGGGISEMFAAEALGALASFVWTSALARRALDTLPRTGPGMGGTVHRVIRFAAMATVNVAMNFVVWQRSAILFLAHFSGDVAVATFSVAFAAMTALRMPFDVTASVVTPTVARFAGAGEQQGLRAGYRRVVWLTLVASLPATVGAIVLGPPAIGPVFGAALAPAGAIVIILAVAFPLVPLGLVGAALLNGLGRQRTLLVSGVVASLLGLVLDVALVPRFGVEGAAWANVATQVLASAWIIAAAARAVEGVALRRHRVARLVVASAAAGLGASAGLALATGLPGVLLGCCLFAATFGAAQSLLRVLDREDRAQVAALLRQCVR
jgi:O-antigen/teichoic acid export membrane protein